MASDLDSEMKPCYPPPEGTAPAAGGATSGGFYGPNFPAEITTEGAPTPAVGTGVPVQFGPGGFAPGPMESPFTTATPVSDKGAGGGRAGMDLDSPMTKTVPKG